MPQVSYFILHLTMIAAGAYFVADIVSLAISSHLESIMEKTPQAASPVSFVAGDRVSRGSTHYNIIVKKNIFNSAPKPSAAVSSGVDPLLARQVTSLPPLNLTLVGTAYPFAIIKDPKEKMQKLYRKGDVIGAVLGENNANKPKLVSIQRNKVELLRGGQKEVLEVKEKSEKKKTVARRASGRGGSAKSKTSGTIKQVSGNAWVLDRRELDDALKNLPQLLTKARVIPSFKDGKPDGFRIFAIAKDSLYDKIGLQNGDILHRINSVDVTSPQNFMKVIGQLKDESNISVDLMRNNQKETFSYEIR